MLVYIVGLEELAVSGTYRQTLERPDAPIRAIRLLKRTLQLNNEHYHSKAIELFSVRAVQQLVLDEETAAHWKTDEELLMLLQSVSENALSKEAKKSVEGCGMPPKRIRDKRIRAERIRSRKDLKTKRIQSRKDFWAKRIRSNSAKGR